MKRSMAARIVSLALALFLAISTSALPGSRHHDSDRSGAVRGTESTALAAGEPERIGGGLRTLMRHRDQGLASTMPDLQKILKVMDELGGAKVGISFDHKLSAQEKKFLETQFGMKFTIADGKLQDLVPIYSAAIPWDSIEPVSRLPYVKQIESYAWPPPAPAMDTSIPAIKANLVWPLTDSQGRQITGKGVRVATYDTGVDIFHPALWQPDPNEAQYRWTDTSGNGYFTPGQATIT